MTRFIVIHRLPDVATQDEIVAAGRAIFAQRSDQARLLHAWIIPADDRLLCEWEALDREVIQAALEGVGLFPVEAVHPAEPVYFAWFMASSLSVRPDKPYLTGEQASRCGEGIAPYVKIKRKGGEWRWYSLC